jgi:hypothetical protein
MNNINDREKALENKYALDQETQFRIEARTSKLLALWVAQKAGLSEEDSKAFAADEPGFEDVKRAIRPLIADKGLDVSEHMLDVQIQHFMEEAQTQIMSEKK